MGECDRTTHSCLDARTCLWLPVSSCLSVCFLLPLLLPGGGPAHPPPAPIAPQAWKSVHVPLFPVPLSASWVQATFPQSQAVIMLSLAASFLHCGLNTKLLSRQRGVGGGLKGSC